jgi:hypothetical protein
VDVRIGEVSTELTVTEAVGPLAPEDVKRLVALVIEQVRQEQDRAALRARDTAITDRAFRPGARG